METHGGRMPKRWSHGRECANYNLYADCFPELFDCKRRKNGELPLKNDGFELKNGPIILQFEVCNLANYTLLVGVALSDQAEDGTDLELN